MALRKPTSPSQKKIDVVAETHTGQSRSLNEDCLLALKRPEGRGYAAALLAVADGMGGHKAGEVASRLAIESLHNSLAWLVDVPVNEIVYEVDVPAIEPTVDTLDMQTAPQTTAAFLRHHLLKAIAEADRRVCRFAAAQPPDAPTPGTTLTCALIVDATAIIANIGDSRTYHLRNGELHLITRDHSLVGMLVRMGQLSQDAIYSHPRRHIITRSLGDGNLAAPDVWEVRLKAGDRLLLCSDGLWEALREPALLRRLLRIPDLATAARSLLHRANQRSGSDNISVIVAEYGADSRTLNGHSNSR